MRTSEKTIPGLPSPMEFAQSIGLAIELISSTRRSSMRMLSIYDFLQPPSVLGQVLFSFHANGRPTGYVAWAYLTKVVLDELSMDSNRRLTLSEWNEGTILTVMDVVAPIGGAICLLHMLREACPAHKDLSWVARRNWGSPRRIWTRRTRGAL